MPIRVNLKEIFPSDPQEINVEKLNFNFNKLLELGVGSPGPIGLTGPQGPAGPIGLVGPQGDRGATWWVDAGDPNTITFSEPLMDGDMYLDQTSNVFQIYQYDALTSTWNTVVSIAAIVNSYLSSVAPSPFTTGPTGVPTSSIKFVVFNNGDQVDPYLDYVNDGTRGAFNASNNKALFLSNFDENILDANIPNLSWPANQNSLYNSLFKIVTAHDDAQASVKADLGRYHLEFGSLYNDGTNILLSELKHNLKGKFFKRYLTSPELAATNEWINTARFSLSLPEPFIAPDVDQNGEFEFVVPKYNAESSLVREEVFVRIGSAEAFEERTNKAAILADGISITNDQVGRSMVVGLREDLGAVLNLPYSTSNFALFDVSDDVDGLFFNKTLIQTGGNFEHIITTGPLQIDQDNFTDAGISTSHFMGQSILANGNTLWISSAPNASTSYSASGYITRYDVSNPDNPLFIASYEANKDGALSAITDFSTDQHGHRTQYANQPLGLIKDIAEFGRYVVTLHHRSVDTSFPYTQSENTDLIIRETDSFVNSLLNVGALSDSNIKDAYRVQVNGRIAWVITNRTYESGPFLLSNGAPTLPVATLSAVSLTDPTTPVVIASYSDDVGTIASPEPGLGTKYLDFDIKQNKAFVLKYRNYTDDVITFSSEHQIEVLLFDIMDPTSFDSLSRYVDFLGLDVKYSPQNSLVLSTFTGGTSGIENGALDVNGNKVYVAYGSDLYVSELTTSLVLRSTTSLSAEPVTATDILVRGNYAYVLVNYSSDSTGAVQVWDISDKTNPIFIDETRNASIYRASRIAISGKNLYIASVTGTTIRLTTFDSTGIESSSAVIGSLKADNLQVTENALIQNNLHVKSGINVGPGGIFIDRGDGLSVDGRIAATVSVNTNNDFNGGLAIGLNNLDQNAITSPFSLVNLSTISPDLYSRVYEKQSYLYTPSGISYLRSGYVVNMTSRLLGTFRYGQNLLSTQTAFAGNQLYLGGIGTTDTMYAKFIGSEIDLGSGVQMQSNDAYGYKFRFAGTSSGTVYGLYIEGADENLVEGNLQAADSIQAGNSSKIKNEWHGFINLSYNTSGSPGGIGAGYEITSANISSSGLDQKGFSIPTLSPAHTCGTGNANSGIGSSEVILKGSLKINTPTFSNVNNVVVHLTPRYANSDESLLLSYISQVNTVSDINIYWRSITGQAAFNSSDNISFNISIYEYDNN